MNKLIIAAIGMVACSMVTGCISQAMTKGGSYAEVPSTKVDEYALHWEHEKGDRIVETATVYQVLGFINFGDPAPWLLRDHENRIWNLFRVYPFETRARNAALYKVCKDPKRDGVLGAMYDVDTDDWLVFKKASCTVRGWPAKITGIEKISEKAK